MAAPILIQKSPNELKREIEQFVGKDQRSLPLRSKIFSAVANIQKFDVLPEVVSVEQINEYVKLKCIELNRGLSSTKGIPSQLYARELVLGAMYPGTLTALGNGIYFAVPSRIDPKFHPDFPKVSYAALKYTKSENSGCLIRAALIEGSKIGNYDEIIALLKQNKDRAVAAGIADIGTFAASMGFDAMYADGIYDDTEERVYTVLNRGAIYVQRTARFIAP